MKPRVMRLALLFMIVTLAITACTTVNPINPNPDPTRAPTSATPNGPQPAATRQPNEPTAPNGQPVLDAAGLIREPVSDADRATAQAIATADIPPGDLRELAIRFKGLASDAPEKTCTAEPDLKEGDQQQFQVFDNASLKTFDVTASLVAKTNRAYMWLDDRWTEIVDRAALIRSAETFTNQTYDRNRSLFGEERSPGVDCDPRIHILNTSGTSAGGYFSSVDQETPQVRSDSNEKDLLYIDIEGAGGPEAVGTAYYDGVIAHEFQHLILFGRDPNEDTWISEGMSELAIFLNGDDPEADAVAAMTPEIQLNTWPDGGVADSTNYGTAFSFMLYFWDRYGDDGVRALAAEPLNGLAGIDKVLEKIDPGKTANELVADWLIARTLDDPSIDNGRYGYAKTDRATVEPQDTIRRFPYADRGSVPQYAGDYIELKGQRDISIDFAGSTKARLIGAEPHSGQYFWWSNRGDVTDLTLTREFDLSGVSQITLKYWAWYALEKDWDYAYLSVSEDGGQRWQIIQAPSTTDSDPVNANYGWGYTGNSGGGEQPTWIEETVDLSSYAGKKVLVRFEVINDLAVNLPGLAIDDVRVPEINYADDFETGDGGWQSGGWLRTNNFVPQSYVVQLISFGQDGTTSVSRLPINADNTARWTVPLSRLRRAVVVVSAMALRTTEVAGFNWSAEEK
ncbi:MAG: immune inhibitor A [Thermoflexales bacterium]|nr:immune inhibitor A [Thermoflexales bacterium]